MQSGRSHVGPNPNLGHQLLMQARHGLWVREQELAAEKRGREADRQKYLKLCTEFEKAKAYAIKYENSYIELVKNRDLYKKDFEDLRDAKPENPALLKKQIAQAEQKHQEDIGKLEKKIEALLNQIRDKDNCAASTVAATGAGKVGAPKQEAVGQLYSHDGTSEARRVDEESPAWKALNDQNATLIAQCATLNDDNAALRQHIDKLQQLLESQQKATEAAEQKASSLDTQFTSSDRDIVMGESSTADQVADSVDIKRQFEEQVLFMKRQCEEAVHIANTQARLVYNELQELKSRPAEVQVVYRERIVEVPAAPAAPPTLTLVGCVTSHSITPIEPTPSRPSASNTKSMATQTTAPVEPAPAQPVLSISSSMATQSTAPVEPTPSRPIITKSTATQTTAPVEPAPAQPVMSISRLMATQSTAPVEPMPAPQMVDNHSQTGCVQTSEGRNKPFTKTRVFKIMEKQEFSRQRALGRRYCDLMNEPNPDPVKYKEAIELAKKQNEEARLAGLERNKEREDKMKAQEELIKSQEMALKEYEDTMNRSLFSRIGRVMTWFMGPLSI
ncbi:hypothetical protein HYFRA_00002309 [Hymenoscyphus fraxineus]|uniref:Uncharacterized protein n=1 Tax=Hymenoscyphus fraxineus TaxID=746836 RepID=A0A9N9Q0I0_9HELO|nr:hypothetical protein HYFRA_00002309 [Hymenoscyphus fraxineus]